MTERYQLVAYLATLATLVIVFVAALVAACIAPGLIGRLEAFGLGTIPRTTSQRFFRLRGKTPTTNVETAATVLGGPQKED